MRTKLQSFLFLRIYPEPGELEFLRAVIAHAGINPAPEPELDGAIVLGEEQIRHLRLSLLNLKTGDMAQEVVLQEFWENLPDFAVLAEEREPIYDNLPLKSDQASRRKLGQSPA